MRVGVVSEGESIDVDLISLAVALLAKVEGPQKESAVDCSEVEGERRRVSKLCGLSVMEQLQSLRGKTY